MAVLNKNAAFRRYWNFSWPRNLIIFSYVHIFPIRSEVNSTIWQISILNTWKSTRYSLSTGRKHGKKKLSELDSFSKWSRKTVLAHSPYGEFIINYNKSSTCQSGLGNNKGMGSLFSCRSWTMEISKTVSRTDCEKELPEGMKSNGLLHMVGELHNRDLTEVIKWAPHIFKERWSQQRSWRDTAM